MMTWDLPFMSLWMAAGSSLTLLLYVLFNRPAGNASRHDRPSDPPTSKGISTSRRAGGSGSTSVDKAIAKRLKEQQPKNELKERIVQAGIYKKNAVFVFLAIRIGSFAALLGVGTFFGVLGLVTMEKAFATGVVFGLLGTIAPSFCLDYLRHRRQTKIRRAMPDALDLISVCLQGGLSLPGSLSRVSSELGTAHPMLAVELGIAEREMQMGLTAGEAMRQFARRFDLEELRSLASVISQAERFGSSVTKALKNYAEGLRTKRCQRAEELAQKAAVKVLFPTLLCIFPGIFIVIMGPAAIRIYQELVIGLHWGG